MLQIKNFFLIDLSTRLCGIWNHWKAWNTWSCSWYSPCDSHRYLSVLKKWNMHPLCMHILACCNKAGVILPRLPRMGVRNSGEISQGSRRLDRSASIWLFPSSGFQNNRNHRRLGWDILACQCNINACTQHKGKGPSLFVWKTEAGKFHWLALINVHCEATVHFFTISTFFTWAVLTSNPWLYPGMLQCKQHSSVSRYMLCIRRLSSRYPGSTEAHKLGMDDENHLLLAHQWV